MQLVLFRTAYKTLSPTEYGPDERFAMAIAMTSDEITRMRIAQNPKLIEQWLDEYCGKKKQKTGLQGIEPHRV